jgi:hypothetical protein
VTDRTHAERQRRYKERQRELKADPVRGFLTAITSWFDKAMNERDQTKVPTWLPGRHAEAQELLELLDTGGEGGDLLGNIYYALERPPYAEQQDPREPDYIPSEPLSEGEKAIVRAAHRTRFDEWAKDPANMPVRAVSARQDANRRTLEWALDEIKAKKANSATLTTGMRAARAIINDRTKPEVAKAYREFTGMVTLTESVLADVAGHPVAYSDLIWGFGDPDTEMEPTL